MTQLAMAAPMAEDMESKMVNALVVALRRMGLATPTTTMPPVMQPSPMPSHVPAGPPSLGTGIPENRPQPAT